MLPQSWPTALTEYLTARYGSAGSVQSLSGQSRANVWRVRFADKSSRVIKSSARPNESIFYQTIAPLLQSQGIPMPYFEQSFDKDGTYWLVLEDIPQPLPPERWQGNREVINTLYRLHHATVPPLPDFPERYQPAWATAMTERVLDLFLSYDRARLAPVLPKIQEKCQSLFNPASPVLISGDPNPTNWGSRADGTLVLFDWERFSKASAALDLAICIPGLGNISAYLEAATLYAQGQPTNPFLLVDIAVAKIWVVIEYLHTFALGELKSTATADKLLSVAPDWILMISRELGLVS